MVSFESAVPTIWSIETSSVQRRMLTHSQDVRISEGVIIEHAGRARVHTSTFVVTQVYEHISCRKPVSIAVFNQDS